MSGQFVLSQAKCLEICNMNIKIPSSMTSYNIKNKAFKPFCFLLTMLHQNHELVDEASST